MKTPDIIKSPSKSPSKSPMNFFAALEAVFNNKKVSGSDWPSQTYIYLTWDGKVWIHNEDGADSPWQLTKADYFVDDWHIWRPH